jgi:hypothetical protein
MSGGNLRGWIFVSVLELLEYLRFLTEDFAVGSEQWCGMFRCTAGAENIEVEFQCSAADTHSTWQVASVLAMVT